VLYYGHIDSSCQIRHIWPTPGVGSLSAQTPLLRYLEDQKCFANIRGKLALFILPDKAYQTARAGLR